jgi:hypothetical protein
VKTCKWASICLWTRLSASFQLSSTSSSASPPRPLHRRHVGQHVLAPRSSPAADSTSWPSSRRRRPPRGWRRRSRRVGGHPTRDSAAVRNPPAPKPVARLPRRAWWGCRRRLLVHVGDGKAKVVTCGGAQLRQREPTRRPCSSCRRRGGRGGSAIRKKRLPLLHCL